MNNLKEIQSNNTAKLRESRIKTKRNDRITNSRIKQYVMRSIDRVRR